MSFQYSTSISTQAKQYNNILQYVRDNCTIKNSLTTKQIYQAVSVSETGVRNEMQVRDALRSMHQKGLISRVKVGGSVQYFYTPTQQDKDTPDVQTSAPTEPINISLDPEYARNFNRFANQLPLADEPAKVPEKYIGPVPPAEPVRPTIPEITIIGNTIVIEHPKCKITLEV